MNDHGGFVLKAALPVDVAAEVMADEPDIFINYIRGSASPHCRISGYTDPPRSQLSAISRIPSAQRAAPESCARPHIAQQTAQDAPAQQTAQDAPA
jgi:hypothetical protein